MMAGVRKMPLRTVEPTSTATALHRPRRRGRRSPQRSGVETCGADMGAGIYLWGPMTRRFTRLAWAAAACTYLLIVLGAVVRVTGSGLGCGEHWPLCNGHLFPPLNDLPTVIEWSHRLVAALLSALVVALAAYAWRLAKGGGTREGGRVG